MYYSFLCIFTFYINYSLGKLSAQCVSIDSNDYSLFEGNDEFNNVYCIDNIFSKGSSDDDIISVADAQYNPTLNINMAVIFIYIMIYFMTNRNKKFTINAFVTHELIFILLAMINKSNCSSVILAKSNACFSATSYLTNYTFNPPLNGEIYGIRLEHESGGVSCDPSTHSNWGCSSNLLFLTEMIKQNQGTYYPTVTTQDVTGFTEFSSCQNECQVWYYQFSSGYTPDSDSIEFIDYSTKYQVTTSDVFSIQYSEGCCNISTETNSGTSCADVYFMYSSNTEISITGCKDWNYGSITNSMQMRLIGSKQSTNYFYVNEDSQLPVDGETIIFEEFIPDDIGDLYSVQLMVDDPYGYCISDLSISYNGTSYNFNSTNYFGSGLILSSECDYSYKYISDNLPLIKCIDGSLDLSVFESRGIYELKLHSCIGDGNGISAQNMKDNVYAVIMGKKSGEQTYTTTTITYLDHFKPSDINFVSLGDLIAGNVLLDTDDDNALYIPSVLSGTLIGIKFEMVNSEQNEFRSTDTIDIKVVDDDMVIAAQDSFENGKYLVVFFDEDDRITLSGSEAIYVSSQDITNVYINIFGIIAGKESDYSLSFAFEGDGGINWFDANEECETKYGTSLVSIHSDDENFIINGFIGEYRSWIGFYDLTLESQNNWKWIDQSNVDYTNWSPFQPDNYNFDDCGEMFPLYWSSFGSAGEWNDNNCAKDSEVLRYVCSVPNWSPNQERLFEINVAEQINDITLISIGNNNGDDNLCIDSVVINGDSATYLSDSNIGGNTGIYSLNGIIKYPVCATEVVGMTIDYDASNTQLINGDSTISGLECTNTNRLLPSTCSISQSYELSKTTSFSISNENSATSEYSWGSASSVSIGTSSSTSTSDEFSWGLEQSVSVGVSKTVEAGVDVGIFSASASVTTSVDVSVGSNQQWTSSTENTNENSKDITDETNEQNTESSTSTDTTESSYETSETTTIECTAEMEVPPSHSMSYYLIFNAFNTSIRTYTDLKLTLCSAFMYSETVDDESHYIYIDNIPGIINHKETTSCNVQFGPSEYIRNDISCGEEQRLAFSSGSTFIPRCQTENTDLYDGCQCDIGDSRTLGQCFCSDNTGNMEINKFTNVEDGDDWKRVCVEELECDNTSVVYTGNAAKQEPIFQIDNNPKNEQPQLPNSLTYSLTFTAIMQNVQSLLISVLSFIGIITLFFVIWILKYIIINNNKKKCIDLFDPEKIEEKVPIKNYNQV